MVWSLNRKLVSLLVLITLTAVSAAPVAAGPLQDDHGIDPFEDTSDTDGLAITCPDNFDDGDPGNDVEEDCETNYPTVTQTYDTADQALDDTVVGTLCDVLTHDDSDADPTKDGTPALEESGVFPIDPDPNTPDDEINPGFNGDPDDEECYDMLVHPNRTVEEQVKTQCQELVDADSDDAFDDAFMDACEDVVDNKTQQQGRLGAWLETITGRTLVDAACSAYAPGDSTATPFDDEAVGFRRSDERCRGALDPDDDGDIKEHADGQGDDDTLFTVLPQVVDDQGSPDLNGSDFLDIRLDPAPTGELGQEATFSGSITSSVPALLEVDVMYDRHNDPAADEALDTFQWLGSQEGTEKPLHVSQDFEGVASIDRELYLPGFSYAFQFTYTPKVNATVNDVGTHSFNVTLSSPEASELAHTNRTDAFIISPVASKVDVTNVEMTASGGLAITYNLEAASDGVIEDYSSTQADVNVSVVRADPAADCLTAGAGDPQDPENKTFLSQATGEDVEVSLTTDDLDCTIPGYDFTINVSSDGSDVLGPAFQVVSFAGPLASLLIHNATEADNGDLLIRINYTVLSGPVPDYGALTSDVEVTLARTDADGGIDKDCINDQNNDFGNLEVRTLNAQPTGEDAEFTVQAADLDCTLAGQSFILNVSALGGALIAPATAETTLDSKDAHLIVEDYPSTVKGVAIDPALPIPGAQVQATVEVYDTNGLDDFGNMTVELRDTDGTVAASGWHIFTDADKDPAGVGKDGSYTFALDLPQTLKDETYVLNLSIDPSIAGETLCSEQETSGCNEDPIYGDHRETDVVVDNVAPDSTMGSVVTSSLVNVRDDSSAKGEPWVVVTDVTAASEFNVTFTVSDANWGSDFPAGAVAETELDTLTMTVANVGSTPLADVTAEVVGATETGGSFDISGDTATTSRDYTLAINVSADKLTDGDLFEFTVTASDGVATSAATKVATLEVTVAKQFGVRIDDGTGGISIVDPDGDPGTEVFDSFDDPLTVSGAGNIGIGQLLLDLPDFTTGDQGDQAISATAFDLYWSTTDPDGTARTDWFNNANQVGSEPTAGGALFTVDPLDAGTNLVPWDGAIYVVLRGDLADEPPLDQGGYSSAFDVNALRGIFDGPGASP